MKRKLSCAVTIKVIIKIINGKMVLSLFKRQVFFTEIINLWR